MSVAIPSTQEELARWDDFIISHPQGNHWQLSWWLACHHHAFAASGILAVEEADRIVTGTVWYRYGFRQCNVTIVSNGPLADPTDVGSLAKAIVTLLSDPQRRRQMALAGQERTRRQYNWITIMDTIDERMRAVVG
jgi:glycosyltransferase involved in cell wall biosynthesis